MCVVELRAEWTDHATWENDKKHVGSIIHQSNSTQARVSAHDIEIVENVEHVLGRNNEALTRMLPGLHQLEV